jgi:hypothetical protein
VLGGSRVAVRHATRDEGPRTPEEPLLLQRPPLLAGAGLLQVCRIMLAVCMVMCCVGELCRDRSCAMEMVVVPLTCVELSVC